MRIQARVEDRVSSAGSDDYDGVLCRSHGDGIPSVMTSRVSGKPTSSSVTVPHVLLHRSNVHTLANS